MESMKLITTHLERDTLVRIKQQLKLFDEPVERAALIRCLLDLWLEGVIPLEAEDLEPYRKPSGMRKHAQRDTD